MTDNPAPLISRATVKAHRMIWFVYTDEGKVRRRAGMQLHLEAASALEARATAVSRAEDAQRVRPGQVWKRKADGAFVTVLEVEPDGLARRTVTRKGKRVTHTEFEPFLRKYALHRDTPIVERVAAVLGAARASRDGRCDDRSDAAALVAALGLHDVFTVAWDSGDPSMSGTPRPHRSGAELARRELAERAMASAPSLRGREGLRIQERMVAEWADSPLRQCVAVEGEGELGVGNQEPSASASPPLPRTEALPSESDA